MRPEPAVLRYLVFRDPATFGHIVNYLSGYEIFPPAYVEPSSSIYDSFMRKLRVDAEFFQLDGLVHLMDKILVPYVEDMKPNERYLAFLGTYRTAHAELEDPADGVRGVIIWNTLSLTDKMRAKAPFNELESPLSGSDFDDYDTLAAVQKILKEKLGKRYLQDWRLVGYKSECEAENFRFWNIILVERIMMASK
ncbi:unnamed protein product [Rhizoctonia solani]|uniref:Potassium channel tetramerisation-type BTB domain-containing protein n=1 Tax=Rhizoctonia solani TaxID=456999 RepID=A0A8H3AX08_9AGAM|nr:unnamed protein product [Rhizoctonia solani]